MPKAMRKRVLVVDDEKDQVEVLCKNMQRRSIHCEGAETFALGVEAAQTARECGRPFDIVLLDLGLKDTDGPHDTLKRTHEFGDTRVIPFTGVDDPSLIREFQKKKMPFILKGGLPGVAVKTILTELEWQAPSEEIERAILDEHSEIRKVVKPQGWIKRNSAPLSAGVAVLTLVVLLYNQATGGVSRIITGVKEGALSDLTIRQKLTSNDHAIENEVQAREQAIKAEREARKEWQDKQERTNDRLVKELEGINSAITVIHGENTASVAERADIKRELSQVHGTIDNIYNLMVQEQRSKK